MLEWQFSSFRLQQFRKQLLLFLWGFKQISPADTDASFNSWFHDGFVQHEAIIKTKFKQFNYKVLLVVLASCKKHPMLI